MSILRFYVILYLLFFFFFFFKQKTAYEMCGRDWSSDVYSSDLIRFVFNQWTLGEEFCTQVLGIPAEKLNDPTFDLLKHLGFSKADIEIGRASCRERV